jgi:23S rRNA (adenine2503-C2)-methyltransferase
VGLVGEPIDILGLSFAQLAEKAKACLSSGSGAAGKIYARAFSRGELDPSALGLSGSSEEAWRQSFSLKLLKPLRVVSEDGEQQASRNSNRATAKAVLGLEDGREIECVRIPMPGGDGSKSTLCVSSQVGCRMGCAFCETGRAGLSRNLRAGEIVAQVLTARIALGWDCGNIVFMGMGECLDNLGEVAIALSVLADQRGLGYAQERMTLCTSGPAGGVEALRKLGLKRLGLSISLNAATDEKRERLMPVNKGNGLDALAASLAAYPLRRNFALGVNWCLLPGINDSREDARQAAAFCAKVGRCVVNLIPYNPGSSPLTRSPTEEEVETFASWLTEAGCFVKRRGTKGSSIMAGCGQLGGGGCQAP